MKTMKKFFSCLLVMVMAVVAMLSVSAFADDNTTTATTYSLSLQNTGATAHTFEVYQIFKGDLSEKDGITTLSNIVWGENVSVAGQTTLGTASTYAETINSSNVATIAGTLSTYLTGTSKTVTVAAKSTGKVENLAAGYYFVKDTAGTQDNSGDDAVTSGAYTSYILEVVKDTTASTKLDVPSVVKKVKDVNESTGVETDWQDSADYKIGMDIPYQITGSLPSNYADYTTYYYQFSDTMSAGLTYTTSEGATINATIKTNDSTDISSYFTETITKTESDETVVTWTCNDLKTITSLTKDSKIIVTYSCELNDQAVMGSAGNPNTVKLTYSNNPNNSGDGDKGTTPEDKNIVFTYKVTVDKYSEEVKDENKLNGAGFTLYKKIKENSEAGFTWTIVGEEIVHTDSNQFGWERLDDGDYKLVETTVPSGYNKMDDVEFTISATHDTTADNPTITELKGTSSSETFTADDNKSTISTNVINKKGSTLPSTGGMGTRIIYILGAILVLGGGVLLISRKRMAA